MDAGDGASETTTGYEYLEHMIGALGADSSQLHLKLFFQKDIVRQQRETIDTLQSEVEELKETIKNLQEEKELFEFEYLEERCKREDLEEKIGCVDSQLNAVQSLKAENAELKHKLHSQLQLEVQHRDTIEEVHERVKELQESASSAIAEKESLQHFCQQQTEKMAAYDQKFDLMKGRYEFSTEKLAADKSALKKTLTRIQTEKDAVADVLEKKLAECVSLQEELERLKACPKTHGDARKTNESLEHLYQQQMVVEMAAYDQRFDLLQSRYEFCMEKLAAEKSALKEALTSIQTEKDTVADELQEKLAECASLREELERLKASPYAQDARKKFEDKCTGPDPMDTENNKPSGTQKNEEVPVKEALDEQQEQWIHMFKMLPIDLQHRILPLVVRELVKTVRARKQVLLMLTNQAMGMKDDSKGRTEGKMPADVAETLPL